MFTGIIEELGRVVTIEATSARGRLEIQARKILDRLAVGSSVAVNGVCLTVTSLSDASFRTDLSLETLERTGLRTLKPERGVNLELPLTPSTPLGGHLVQGHVDATGVLQSLEPAGEGYWLRVAVPDCLARYLVEKGSVAIDGISLTVAGLAGNELGVAIIPHTYEMTNLRELTSGDLMNIECDILAKYLEKLLGERAAAPRKESSKITRARLLEEGF